MDKKCKHRLLVPPEEFPSDPRLLAVRPYCRRCWQAGDRLPPEESAAETAREAARHKLVTDGGPGWFKKGVNFVRSVARHLVAGSPVLPRWASDARLSVCAGCEQFDVAKRVCRKCGCYMDLKATWAEQQCPLGKWPPWPVPGPPETGDVRSLLYHVFPLKGNQVWRWNLEQLRRRLSLFNGRRVVGVAQGWETEPVSAVEGVLAGLGCEFLPAVNDPGRREGPTYLPMMARVAELTGPQHATFFGHAKGVTSESVARFGGVRRWTEAMYAACLDHWPWVRKALISHPLAGPFKREGYRFPESTRSAWHFSGSFRWFRNADVFSRDWRDLESHWCAVEAHPSLTFSSGEAAELTFGVPEYGLGLYEDSYWRARAARKWAQWQGAHAADRLEPLLLTCVLVSHRKPRWVHEAVKSVLAQTCPDWHLVVIDSGGLVTELRPYAADPRVTVLASPDGARCQGWQINECFRRGLVWGDLVCYLSDDDVYEPGAFAAWLAAARASPGESAWYGPADRCAVYDNGLETKLGDLDPGFDGVPGGTPLAQRIDGIQVCHRRTLAARWPEEEDREARRLADARFLIRLQAGTAVRRLPVRVGRHRHTGVSEFTKAGADPRTAAVN